MGFGFGSHIPTELHFVAEASRRSKFASVYPPDGEIGTPETQKRL